MTGSSGFIGSHLRARLGSQHEIHDLQSDLLDFSGVEQEVNDFQPEVIVHLAARTEVEKSFYEQTTFSQINYVGSVNLIEAAHRVPGFRNFVFASTMEVYGWQPISDRIKAGEIIEEIPAFNETTEPHPNAPYSVAKLAVEKYLEYMHRSLAFPFTAIRQTNAYGRRDNEFFVMEQIITQMLRNPNEINLGYGEPYRNFIFIEDLLDIWQLVIEKADLGLSGKIFTIGPNNPIRISDLVDKIASKLGWSGQVNWNTKPRRPGEIYLLNSDHTLITSMTGWQPKVSLDKGIDRTIEIWRDNLDIR
jgi:UDP-glucose 4-epimerase